jgi:probable HAF family extracellular repeat protein
MKRLLAGALLAIAIAIPLLVLSASTSSWAQVCGGGANPCFEGLSKPPFVDNCFVGGGSVSSNGSTVVGYCATAINGTFYVNMGYSTFTWFNGLVSELNLVSNSNNNAVATGLSGNGNTVVGYEWYCDPNQQGLCYCPANQAYRYPDFILQGYDTSVLSGINADGSVMAGSVGFGWTCHPSMSLQGVRVTFGGGVTLLGFLPGHDRSKANGISADGNVLVGDSFDYSASDPTLMLQAFRWTGGVMTGLGFLPGTDISSAAAVSADGQVVVGAARSSSNSRQRAFRWAGGAMTELGCIPGQSSTASSFAGAANGDGSVIVGGCGSVAGRWSAATGMRSIQEALTALGVSTTGWQLLSAAAITPDGTTIVGNGIDPDGSRRVWIARLPLPSATGNAHDFNGDGKSDILWRQTGGATALWLMNAAQVASSGGLGTVPSSWQIVGQRDFNGDGKHDLLWRDGTSGTVAIWLLNGQQMTQSGSLGAVGASWVIAGTGDFNGDGKADILWRDTSSGTVAVWLLNGLQVTQPGSLGTVGASWVIAGTGDFNGDGKADILWRDTSSGMVAIWLLNGLQVTQTGALGTVGVSWVIAGTGDFNGDGKADILWRDTSGTVAIWLLNGLSVSSSAALGAVPAEWTIAETGDFNGDGKSDLLWRNTTSGAVATWFLNGTQVSSSAGVATVGLDWTIQGLNAD